MRRMALAGAQLLGAETARFFAAGGRVLAAPGAPLTAATSLALHAFVAAAGVVVAVGGIPDSAWRTPEPTVLERAAPTVPERAAPQGGVEVPPTAAAADILARADETLARADETLARAAAALERAEPAERRVDRIEDLIRTLRIEAGDAADPSAEADPRAEEAPADRDRPVAVLPQRKPDPSAAPRTAQDFGVPDHPIPPKVAEAIRYAAKSTGLDAALLLAVASQESGFDADARNRRSSAGGLFQFTDTSFMRAMAVFGDRHGHADLAKVIRVDNERRTVAAPNWNTRQRIMALKDDPRTSAALAAELMLHDKAKVETMTGRRLGAVDTYVTHLLGVVKAVRFLRGLEATPNAPAANALPIAAKANPALFRLGDGRPASFRQVYAKIDGIIQPRIDYYTVAVRDGVLGRKDAAAHAPVSRR